MIVKFRKRDNPYAQIDKRGLNDSRLSYKARGILACCMTMPSHLRVSVAFLIEHSPDGKKSVQAGFRDLRDNGYAKIEIVRSGNGQIIGRQWVLYECPSLLTDDAKMGP